MEGGRLSIEKFIDDTDERLNEILFGATTHTEKIVKIRVADLHSWYSKGIRGDKSLDALYRELQLPDVAGESFEPAILDAIREVQFI